MSLSSWESAGLGDDGRGRADLDDEALAGASFGLGPRLVVVVDFVVALALGLLVAAAAVDDDDAGAAAVEEVRLGGLKGSCLRFCAGFRSEGMVCWVFILMVLAFGGSIDDKVVFVAGIRSSCADARVRDAWSGDLLSIQSM